MLGCDLVPALRDGGHEVLASGREDCDICDAAKVLAVVGETRPDVIIHAAAYTHVDGAESEPELAVRVNGEGTRNVARAYRDYGIGMVYISTDYIFDGTKREPYLPEGIPNSLNVYGHSNAGDA